MRKTDSPRYHFIGIGGIGMSGLAELLVRQGFRVSGSDLAANAITTRLETLGVTFYQGHRPEHIGGAEIVVHSTAVKEDNPELAAARASGREVLRRGEMLARLMAGHHQIAVTGAHGKTSTTAMVAAVLRAGGLDPSVMVGAIWDSLGSNAVLGKGGYFVAEADESDASFACLKPQTTIITNLDREHLDYYRDMAHIQETFAAYLDRLPPESLVVAWADDPHLTPLLNGRRHNLLTYRLDPEADFWASHIEVQGLGCRYRLLHQGQELGEIRLPLAGVHYVLNSLAACAVAASLGLPFSVWQEGLAHLGQIHRRCQVKGQVRGIMVVDDYGHHPTEIETTLAALAQAFPERRLVVAFQPHRFSRTRALLTEFFPVFRQADQVWITEIYSAGEEAVPGLSGRHICEGVCRQDHPAAHFVPDQGALLETLLNTVKPGDIILTLGAGDIWRVGEDLLSHLSDHSAAPLTSKVAGAPSCRGARP
jgi:UDP-N-acetylmuramate--alanine ligase